MNLSADDATFKGETTMSDEEVVKDVVCGMYVSPKSLEITHEKQSFAFCSLQCRERFLANPHLYVGRPGHPAPKQQGKAVIKQRRFLLDEPLNDAQAVLVGEAIRAMMGIEALVIDGAQMSVTYDLLQVTAQQIETALTDAGAEMGQGWADRLRRGFVHYTEECEIGQLQVGPPSGCH